MSERKGPHIIGRVVWELETEDRAHAHETQERISQLFRIRLTQVLESVLDECDPQGELLRYHRIELDLGEFLMQELDADLERRLRKHLLDALKISQPGVMGTARTEVPERIPLPESQLRRLLAYLQTGLLSGPVPDPDTIPALAASLLEHAPERLLAGLRQAGPAAAPRLSMQLPQPMQEQLLAALLGSAWAPVAAWAGRILAAYRSSPLPGLPPADLYRLLLEGLWAQALSAQPPARLAGWQQGVRIYWDQTRAPVAADARFARVSVREAPQQAAAYPGADSSEAGDPDADAAEVFAAPAGQAGISGQEDIGSGETSVQQALAALRHRLAQGRWPWWAPAAAKDDQLQWLDRYGPAAAQLMRLWLELPAAARLRMAQGIWRSKALPAPERLLQAWVPDHAGLFVLVRRGLEAWELSGVRAWLEQRYAAAALSFVLIRGTRAPEGPAWIGRVLRLLADALPQPEEDLRRAWLAHLAGLEAKEGARWAALRRMTPDSAAEGPPRPGDEAAVEDHPANAGALPAAGLALKESAGRLHAEPPGAEGPDAEGLAGPPLSVSGPALSEAAAWAGLTAPDTDTQPPADAPASRQQLAAWLASWIRSGTLPPDAEAVEEQQLAGAFGAWLRGASPAELRAWLRDPAAAARMMQMAAAPGMRGAVIRKLAPLDAPRWRAWMQAVSRLLRTDLLPGVSAAWLERASIRLAAADAALDEAGWLKGILKFAVRELRIHPLRVIQALSQRLRHSASRHREPMLALLRGLEQQALRVPAPEAQRQPPKPRLPDGTPVYIQNAGLVLTWPLLPFLFQTLEYVTPERKWRTEQAQQRAVHLLQYIVNKRTDLPEPMLPLNKLLCGLPLDAPVPASAELTERETELAEALLTQICKRWPPLKNSSNDGLRGSFLIREGRLSLEEEFWTLRVEQKSVDLLLASLPWALNRVKLPWMPSVLLVEWR
ncbi:MAG: contractile injection system tape measure protein [Bacteroidia bacterium]|nr:contractile injection system tape measure protein [Bacteroidia bacterium]